MIGRVTNVQSPTLPATWGAPKQVRRVREEADPDVGPPASRTGWPHLDPPAVAYLVRLRMAERASRAVSSASGKVCKYFSVVAILP